MRAPAVVVVLLLTLMLAEVVARGASRLRLVEITPRRVHGSRLAPGACHVWSRYTHHEPEAGCTIQMRGVPEDGIPPARLTYNSHGMRGPEIGPKRRQRVLLLGDSFIEATFVPLEATVGSVLGHLAPYVEVIQHGVSSWSPVVEAAWFLRHRLEIDRVYLFVVDNDFFSGPYSDAYYRRLYQFDASGLPATIPALDGHPLPRWLDHSPGVLLLLAPFGLASMRWKPDAPLFISSESERIALRLKPEAWPSALQAGVAATLTSLRSFAAYCRSHGIALTVVYVPLGADIDANENTGVRGMLGLTGSAYFKESKLEQVLASSGITILSLTEPFRRAKRGDSRANVLFFRRDGHWTAEGHRTVARALADDLATAAPGLEANGGRVPGRR